MKLHCVATVLFGTMFAQVDAFISMHTRPAVDFYSLQLKLLDGSTYPFAELKKDKAVLIINVASKSEKTDEYYKALAELNYKFGGQGFEIIAVPCSQFGDEPGGPHEIMSIASSYRLRFKFLEKSDVNGEYMSPLYKFLRLGGDANINASFATSFVVQCNPVSTCQVNRIDNFMELGHSAIHEQIQQLLAPSSDPLADILGRHMENIIPGGGRQDL